MDTHIPEEMRKQMLCGKPKWNGRNADAINAWKANRAPFVNHDDELFGRVSTIDPDDVISESERKASTTDDRLEKFVAVLQLFCASVGVMAMALAAGLYASGFFGWIATKMPDNKVLQFLFG